MLILTDSKPRDSKTASWSNTGDSAKVAWMAETDKKSD
jgi:hypothetical protein